MAPSMPRGAEKVDFPGKPRPGGLYFSKSPEWAPTGGGVTGWGMAWFALGPSEHPKTRLGESRNPAFEATKMSLEGIGNRGVGH